MNNVLAIWKKRKTDFLKNLSDKREIPIEQSKDLSPSGSRTRIMYGLAKAYKIAKDGLPSIFSAMHRVLELP